MSLEIFNSRKITLVKLIFLATFICELIGYREYIFFDSASLSDKCFSRGEILGGVLWPLTI